MSNLRKQLELLYMSRCPDAAAEDDCDMIGTCAKCHTDQILKGLDESK